MASLQIRSGAGVSIHSRGVRRSEFALSSIENYTAVGFGGEDKFFACGGHRHAGLLSRRLYHEFWNKRGG